MICVSIGRSRHKHVIAEHAHLAELGAQLVEIRLDYIARDVNLQRLIRERPCPVIVTCRRESDGGRWSDTEEARLTLLRTAIAEGVEYVDLEEDAAAAIPRFGKTKRIVSMHDFNGTPDNLTEIHGRLASLDADIVKMATMANSPLDGLRMLKLTAQSKVPTVAFCMGEMGTPTRILCGRFGAPFTYAAFHSDRALAPGQLSFQEMQKIYNFEQVGADWEVYGVIADPVAHSLSPLIHNSAFRSRDMARVYLPFRVPESELVKFLQHAREFGIRGLSVTIPHKEAVVARCNKVEGIVRGIGAVNTMVFQPDGTVLGYNTDYRASMEELLRAVGVDGNTENSLAGQKALVLGAGGVSKSIAFGLGRKGATLAVASRTMERSRSLAEKMGGKAIAWSDRHKFDPDILVNGTPLGMHPHVDDSPYEQKFLRTGMVVFDTVYNPEQTLLIKYARQAHCRIVTGVDMFVRQAALQFQLFTGEEAPTELMRETLKRSMSAAKYD